MATKKLFSRCTTTYSRVTRPVYPCLRRLPPTLRGCNRRWKNSIPFQLLSFLLPLFWNRIVRSQSESWEITLLTCRKRRAPRFYMHLRQLSLFFFLCGSLPALLGQLAFDCGRTLIRVESGSAPAKSLLLSINMQMRCFGMFVSVKMQRPWLPIHDMMYWSWKKLRGKVQFSNGVRVRGCVMV